jgi:hypothetical protein
MVKVELPRASWEVILDLIDDSDSPMKFGLYREVYAQVYSQEY